jgi:hypothetical protein
MPARFVPPVLFGRFPRLDEALRFFLVLRAVDGQSQVLPERIDDVGDARPMAKDAADGCGARMAIEHAADDLCAGFMGRADHRRHR